MILYIETTPPKKKPVGTNKFNKIIGYEINRPKFGVSTYKQQIILFSKKKIRKINPIQ